MRGVSVVATSELKRRRESKLVIKRYAPRKEKERIERRRKEEREIE